MILEPVPRMQIWEKSYYKLCATCILRHMCWKSWHGMHWTPRKWLIAIALDCQPQPDSVWEKLLRNHKEVFFASPRTTDCYRISQPQSRSGKGRSAMHLGKSENLFVRTVVLKWIPQSHTLSHRFPQQWYLLKLPLVSETEHVYMHIYMYW